MSRADNLIPLSLRRYTPTSPSPSQSVRATSGSKVRSLESSLIGALASRWTELASELEGEGEVNWKCLQAKSVTIPLESRRQVDPARSIRGSLSATERSEPPSGPDWLRKWLLRRCRNSIIPAISIHVKRLDKLARSCPSYKKLACLLVVACWCSRLMKTCRPSLVALATFSQYEYPASMKSPQFTLARFGSSKRARRGRSSRD